MSYNKYGRTIRNDVAGRSFDSKLEKAVYDILWLRERAGEIKIICQQSSVYMTKARIQYIADFKCLDVSKDEEFWVEAKGFPTRDWRLKRRLWLSGYGPGRLEIWMGSYNKPFLKETIEPKENLSDES